ncbi:carbohydrate ABC transporter permease [Streptomyces sp. NBC_01508]|uniref:carbohydrate ABC transporter permease n=1 Tax=Streptomyces sp. NBC_01508 TaxID=2903888 RepID=UPI003869FB43
MSAARTTPPPPSAPAGPENPKDSKGSSWSGPRTDGGLPQSDGGRLKKSGVYVLLSIGLLVMAAPFLWMGLSAFKTDRDLAASPPVWIPTKWTLEHFGELLDRLDIQLYFFNSLTVAVLVTVSNLVFCSMLGYALAKLRFGGRNKVFALVLGALMVPGNLMLLPLFVLMSKLQLIDSYAGLVLPFAAQAFGVFLMRQFMQSLPDELLEAARIDGAGEWYIFWRIAMPLVKPALATLSILILLGSWNNFVWPLIATNDPGKYTLPVALATFATDPNQSDGSNGMLMVGSLLIILPVLLVFIVLQRHFTQGLATTGMK